MPTTYPWHSTRKDQDKVHHNNTLCVDGNNIESYYRKAGTGGLPLCARCARLNAEGK